LHITGCAGFYSISVNPLFLDRRSKAVKAFTRRSCLALATVGILAILGVTGCGADNEAEGQKLGKALGDAGKPNPSEKVETPKPVTSQKEHFQQTQQSVDQMKKTMPGKSR
jgi:hypothetical protein